MYGGSRHQITNVVGAYRPPNRTVVPARSIGMDSLPLTTTDRPRSFNDAAFMVTSFSPGSL